MVTPPPLNHIDGHCTKNIWRDSYVQKFSTMDAWNTFHSCAVQHILFCYWWSISHLSLNRKGCWGTTDDFTSFLHFSLFSTTLWDLANSRPIHSLMSSHLFLCLPCLLPPFIVPRKMVLTRPDEHETWPYQCSLHLFIMVRRSLCGPIACWISTRTSLLVTWSLRCVVSCRSTSLPWLACFFGALLLGSMIHKHTRRWMWLGSASSVSWNWEKYSCQSKLVSTLSMLLLSVYPGEYLRLGTLISYNWQSHGLYVMTQLVALDMLSVISVGVWLVCCSPSAIYNLWL